jgi:hypothetical protein
VGSWWWGNDRGSLPTVSRRRQWAVLVGNGTLVEVRGRLGAGKHQQEPGRLSRVSGRAMAAWLGMRVGGAGHRRLVSAVARGSGSLDFAKSDAPVAKSSRAWVWDGLRDMYNPPRALAGLGRALGCGCDDSGGSAQHGINGVHAFDRASARIRLQKAVGVCSVQVQAKERCERHCGRLATTRLQRERWRSASGRRSDT